MSQEQNPDMAFHESPQRRPRLCQFSNNLGTLSSVALVYIYMMKQLQVIVRPFFQYLHIEPMRSLPAGMMMLFATIHILSLFFLITRDKYHPRNYVLASVVVIIAQLCTMIIYLSMMMY